MSDDNETREQGVEFGPLADDLEEEEYPISNAELVETYGDRELDLQDGRQTVQEVLEPLGEATYESADDVMQGIIGLVSDEAIGRKNESDRGVMTSSDDENDEGEPDESL